MARIQSQSVARGRTFCAALLLGAAAFVGASCTRGELHLPGPQATGGTESAEGGAPPASGGSGEGGGNGACGPGFGPCPSCEQNQDCPPSNPFCGPEGHCNQCVESAHCLGLFGGDKALCWGGVCTGCRSNFDCPFDLECKEGRCGRCVEPSDCPDDLRCIEGACRP